MAGVDGGAPGQKEPIATDEAVADVLRVHINLVRRRSGHYVNSILLTFHNRGLRIEDRCVFYKPTIKVCVSCC